MKNAHNDNNDPFQTLAAATAKALRLTEKSDDRDNPEDDKKQNPEGKTERETHAGYVEHRLRELREFEARADGARRRPRRGA